MKTILGMPRNAAIAATSIVLSASALALGFLVPWPNSTPEEAPAASAVTTKISPLDPTRINVDFNNLNVNEAVLAFADQTSLPITMPSRATPPPPPMSMHLKNAPLLEGVFQLLRGTQTSFNEFTTLRVTVYPYSMLGNSGMGVWSISGPFAVVLTRLERSVELRPGVRASNNSAQLSGYFYAEPKSKVMQFPQAITFDEFTDDKQQPITSPQNRINSYQNSSQVPCYYFDVQLLMPESPGKKIAVMKGSVNYTVASKFQVLQTNDPGQTLSQEAGDLAVEISPITSAGSPAAAARGAASLTYMIPIQYFRNKMEPALWNQMQNTLARTEVTVFNSSDEKLSVSSTGTTSRSADSMRVQVQVRSTPQFGEPHHVRIEVPTEMREVPVPFEFKNLILP